MEIINGNNMESINSLLLALDAEMEDGRIYSPVIDGELYYAEFLFSGYGKVQCFVSCKKSDGIIDKVFTGFGGEKLKPRGSCSAEEYLTGKQATREVFERAGEIAAKDLKLIEKDTKELTVFFARIHNI